jgi:hypothetical protein
LPRTLPAEPYLGVRLPFVFNATLSAVGFVSNAPLDQSASPTASDCYKWADVGQLVALTNPDNGASANCRPLGMMPDGRPVIEDTSGDSYDGLLFVIGREFPGTNAGGSSEQISGSTPHAASFDGVAPDGGAAYVTTTDKLSPEAEADSGSDLYAVAVPIFSPPFSGPPSASSAVCVSCGHNGGGATFVGQSADGSHVFFSTPEGLWSWDARSGVASELTTATDVSQIVSSANGQYIVGLAHNPSGTGDVYEFAVGQPPRLITSEAPADEYMLNGGYGGSSAFPTVGGVADSGQRVVYDDLPASGVPGVIDEWVAGETHQLSPIGSTHAYFVLGTAGAELEDVFFLADEPLVPQDLNAGTTDIYDARIDGGFPAPVEESAHGTTPDPIAPQLSPHTSNITPTNPVLVPLPADTSHPASASTPKSLTRAKKLAQTLRACKKQLKKKRVACEVRARKKYGAKPEAKKTSRRGAR